jgi:endonuclease YncB( thermonuclease family)
MAWWDDDVEDMDAFTQDATWNDGSRLHRVHLSAFDNQWAAADLMQTDVDTATPVAHAPTRYVPTVAIGHTLTVEGTTYHIIGVEPDGNGLTRMRLSKDS